MGPRVFHAKFQPDRPKGVGLTTSGGQQLLGEQLILIRLFNLLLPLTYSVGKNGWVELPPELLP